MRFSHRARGVAKALAVALALALPMAASVSPADARIGGGLSSGSRGARTFSMPPRTSTAPGTASPFSRSFSQPGTPGYGANTGGLFNRPGGGLLRGFAAGFLGAGLFGLLFGGGLFGGLGGMSSLLGLILQIGLIVLVVRLAMSWWRRRNNPQSAYAGSGSDGYGGPSSLRAGGGFGMGSGSAPLEIVGSDYEAFERVLGQTQEAWSNEDIARLHTLATPEMVSYFTRDIEANRQRNVINKVSATKLLQGDLAEAWREGSTDYATVAMRFSMIDKTVDRANGRLVEGSESPAEATEIWTFVRPPGANWELSAIQQTN
jgi:predicted lipid-binding transport protein (Tim44 family)